jgi:hypothetical protein
MDRRTSPINVNQAKRREVKRNFGGVEHFIKGDPLTIFPACNSTISDVKRSIDISDEYFVVYKREAIADCLLVVPMFYFSTVCYL